QVYNRMKRMIGEMKHDVRAQYHIRNAHRVFQQRMQEWLLTLSFFLEYIREIHEMPEIMYAASRYQAFLSRQVQFADQVIEQPAIHLFVEYKTDGFAFTPVL